MLLRGDECNVIGMGRRVLLHIWLPHSHCHVSHADLIRDCSSDQLSLSQVRRLQMVVAVIHRRCIHRCAYVRLCTILFHKA